MMIPLVDLKANLEPIRAEVLKGFERVFDQTNFILGQEVKDFERSFASFCRSAHAIGVSDGTHAIHLALRAAGIGPGDEVLVPANTFIATAVGVTLAQATPVPVDVNERDFLMDPQKAEAALTPKTRAIIPVHLFGRMVDLDPFEALCKKQSLALIEDAAQAHGAEISGKRVGSVGLMACFSFYPGKNLGALGDGGSVTTQSEEIKNRLEALRNYGSTVKYHHPVFGINSRLDTLQAVVLSIKLKHLEEWNRKRYNAAQKLSEALAGIGDLVLPEIPTRGSHVFHLYVVRTKNRDALLKHLNEKGIGAAIHYPSPIHLHGAYSSLGYKLGAFPVTEKLAQEILSLPIFPELTEAQVSVIAAGVASFFKG